MSIGLPARCAVWEAPVALVQTLDRGLWALRWIAEADGTLTMAQLAARLQVHRAIAYRLVSTLEAHHLVARDQAGRLTLGSGVMALSAQLAPQLRQIVDPALQALAAETQATAFLSVAQGADCVVLAVAEPAGRLLQVGYRVGSRHPLTQGAAGFAILAGRPPEDDEPEAVTRARRDGMSVTSGQLQPGATGVAAPVKSDATAPWRLEACIGVVALADLDVPRATAAVSRCATETAQRLGQ